MLEMRRSDGTSAVAIHEAVEALDPAVTTAAMQLLDNLFENFGACSPEVGTVPEGTGSEPAPTSGQGWWTKVQCPWFPSAMSPLYLGYVQYVGEPPQVVRARFAYDGEAIDLSVHGRILYNEPAPESASLPTKQPWPIRKPPPTRPGATHREISEHERRKRQLGVPWGRSRLSIARDGTGVLSRSGVVALGVAPHLLAIDLERVREVRVEDRLREHDVVGVVDVDGLEVGQLRA